MAIAMKWLLAVVFFAATMALMVLIATAQNITGGLNNSNQATISGAGSGGGLDNSTGTIVSGGGGSVSNDLLLVNDSSYLLQTDAVSKICLAGGC
jgi:hypothetical protein